ncbi:MAG: DUF3427 domain-containing protein [Deltaproteobacteria bacterium]|nr:DUF3427 domain-containing protein [Deltaproteobacteria bacterium]
MADVLVAALADTTDAAVSVAFVQSSGLHLLLSGLAAARLRGARVRVLTSTYLDVTEPQALRALQALPGVELRVQDGPQGFHAKAHLLVSHGAKTGWVGSSNWSRAGLRDNVEWNVRVDDPATFEEAWQRFEELWRRPDVVTPDAHFLAAYTARWKALRLAALAPPPVAMVAEKTVAYAPVPTPTAIQHAALQLLAAQRAQGVRRALVVAATGVGKTLLAAFDAHAAGARKILFVAHRKDIVAQAAKEFARVFGGALDAEVLIDGARPHEPTGGGAPRDAAFVTIQSLSGKGAAALRARSWDYVVVDEFHHAEAERWKKTLFALDARFLLGLTATPERADGRNVMDLCDGNVVFEVRLPEAIRMGALLRFHYFGIADDEAVDYGAIRGEKDEDAIGRALSVTSRVDLVLRHAAEKGYDGVKRVGVGFCAGVRHAEFMRDEFAARGHAAAVVHGGTPTDERAAIYENLQSLTHPLQWIFVADVLNEGVDLPAINTVLFLRPTESSVVFLQQLGRGLRKYPGTEVLTVLDFVGLHRGAFESLLALHDPNGVPTVQSRAVARALHRPITPPEGCEIILEDKTLQVLEKVRKLTQSKRARVEDAYRVAREQLGRAPLPVDGLRVSDLTSATVRTSHGGWRALRVAMGDADAWERELEAGSLLDTLLGVAERNFQLQRVDGYAALWAALDVDDDLAAAYARFFDEQPQWRAEYTERGRTEVIEALVALLTKAGGDSLWQGNTWVATLAKALRVPAVRASVRARLAATMASDYQLRHGGVLRAPADLRPFASYTRQEIVNHFGEQYDPTIHNLGVLRSQLHPGHYVLLARIDTSGAKAEHQYANRVLDRRRFAWTSQNKMTPVNKAGAFVARQQELGARVHLFAAPGSHTPYRYLGEVRAISLENSGPMRVTFELPEAMPDAVFEALGDPSK